MDSKVCQSCGMPLNDENLGTNKDGSKNKKYCKFCFENGEFKDKGVTMKEKIEKLVEFARTKMGMDESQARAMAQDVIPKLKRWKR
ncbi:transcriptional regulator [Candidatus Pacearchaeota archaeon]|nr:transcriptional regulator [Candidatus Pacearchaeota archaeon]MBD3283099.1 transcriptional regulator [Candidatus Pacearchaeota archaeon]